MIRFFLTILTLTVSPLFSFEKLPDEYLITYGRKNAKVEIIQYFSLSCPHCVQIFKNDFLKIYEQYIEKGDLRYVFHPVPVDLTTVQFMCCLERLDEVQKTVLLKVLLEELSLDNPEFNVILMKKGMEIFKSPINDLEKEEFIRASHAFSSSRDFVIQEDSLKTVPSIQIGDRIIEKAPEYSFISILMNKLFLKESDYEL
jgi:hypothetical protein